MSEASSHGASTATRLAQAIEEFETPRAVALTCLDKNADQIHSLLLDVADAIAKERGFSQSMAQMRALRYASEAIEWLWKNTEQARV